MIVPTKTISSNNQHSTSLREKGSMDKIIGFHLGIWDSLSPQIGRDPNQASTWLGSLLAEREGFEPPEPLSSTVFKTAAIDHSAISPSFRIWATQGSALLPQRMQRYYLIFTHTSLLYRECLIVYSSHKGSSKDKWDSLHTGWTYLFHLIRVRGVA